MATGREQLFSTAMAVLITITIYCSIKLLYIYIENVVGKLNITKKNISDGIYYKDNKINSNNNKE